MSMTDEQVVRVMAERDGRHSVNWIINWIDGWSMRICDCGYTAETLEDAKLHEVDYGPCNYLSSRDALQPVLEKLTEEERHALCNSLFDLFANTTGPDEHNYEHWLLTIPTDTQARIIAEAIEGCRGVAGANDG